MENLNFVAIDFETATENRSSICEIGVSVIRNSKIVETKSWLVKPENNQYSVMNISIHGITPSMTKDSPTFSQVWHEVLPYIENQIVIAHNTAFDMYALKDALDKNQIPYPHFKFYCSLRAAKYVIKDTYGYSLSWLSYLLKIPYETEHRAEYDASVAAQVFIYTINKAEVSSLQEFETKYDFTCGEFHDNFFKPQLSNRKYITKPKKKTADYIGDPTKIDQDNYFYNKTVCFTGKCSYGTRDQMLQKVADIGGIPMNSVTKDTDILVVGQQDFRIVGEDGLSSKQEKAMRMKDKGQDIEIMSEVEFQLLISNSSTQNEGA